jgi:hypothetical protein
MSTFGEPPPQADRAAARVPPPPPGTEVAPSRSFAEQRPGLEATVPLRSG